MKTKYAWTLPAIFALSTAVSALTAHASLGAAIVSDLENIAVAELDVVLPPAMVSRMEHVAVVDLVRVVPSILLKHSESISVSDSETLTPAVRLNVAESIKVADVIPDQTPPSVTLTTVPSNPTNSNQASFAFSITDPDDRGGFAAFCQLDGAAFGPCTSTALFTNLADGRHAFTIYAADLAGNRSQNVSYSWLVDTTPPTVQCAQPDTSWHPFDVTLACTASDSGSGLANAVDARFSLSTNVPFGTETANASTNSHQVCDVVSNCVTAGPITGVKVDKKAPAITASAVTLGDGKPYVAGTWTNQSVQVSFSCVDAGSGVNASTLTGPIIVSSEGKAQSVSGSCADVVGNTSTTSFGDIDIDKTPPTIVYTGRTAPNAAGWNNTTVTLTWSCVDNLSGPVSSSVSQSITTEGRNQSATGTCTDKAGNSASDTEGAVNIDKTPPTITYMGRTTPNAAGWNNTNVTLTWNCVDILSGPVSSSVSQSITTEGRNQSATGTCTDNAGNSAGDTEGGVNIDKTPPTISITSPAAATYFLNQPVPADYGCADALSGVAVCAGPVANLANIDTASPGTKSFTVNAVDVAGNQAALTVNYTVSYRVCILYDQTATHQSGSTIPIKLQLCDATGNDVSSASVTVTALSVIQVSTSTTGAPVASGNANHDNNFRFDSSLGTTGGYIYNLSTKGLSSGSYVVSFSVSGDPVTHSVGFQIQ